MHNAANLARWLLSMVAIGAQKIESRRGAQITISSVKNPGPKDQFFDDKIQFWG